MKHLKQIIKNYSPICMVFAAFILMENQQVAAQTYSNTVIQLNPVGYWPLDETTAPPQSLDLTAHNLGSFGVSGNGYYGAWYQPSGNIWSITNNIVQTTGATADGDQALNCQYAPGQYIVLPRNTNGVPNDAITINVPFSIEAWVQPQTVAARSGRIVSQGEVALNSGGSDTNNPFYGGNGTSWAGFVLGQYQNYFAFVTFNTNGESKANELDSPKTIVAGKWIHLVVTFDGTHEIMYENGVPVNTKTVTANAAELTYVPDPTSPLMIGSGNDVSANFAVAYTGGIDEVAIYTNVLSAASIETHYQTAIGTNATYGANYTNAVLADDPTIYFRMDDPQSRTNIGYPSGTFPVANNYGSAGSAGDGVYQPGTTPGVAGPDYAGFGDDSHSVAINGWFGAVDVGNSNLPSSLNPTGTSQMTVVSWFKTGPSDSPGRLQDILGHGDSSYRLTLSTNADNHFNPGPGPELSFTNYANVATNGFAFNDGQWHMVAGVSDGTNDYLYLDGVLARSASNAAGINIVGNTTDLLLGGDSQYTTASASTGNTIRNFDGQIAQVAFWTNALSATDIQSLFTAADVPPYLWQEPQSITNNAGANVTVATGIRGSDLTYQWYQNGEPVATQTNEDLIFSPATSDNTGSYYLIANNSYGSVTSSVINVTVYGPPTIQEQSLTDMEIFNGASPTLHVTASGAQPISYQWTLNGDPILGATNADYTAYNVQSSGTYGCTVTNIVRSTSISPISLTVVPYPTAPYPQQVLADGPMAYFRLDESSGATAYDYVGGNNGVYTNVTLGLPGYNSYASIQSDPNETAAEFGDIPQQNANNDYVGNVPGYINFGTPNGSNAEFSVEAWFTEYGYLNGNCIVGLGYGFGEQFVLDTGATSSGDLRFLVRNAAGTASSASSSYSPNNDGLWHHVVGVCDEASGHLYLYMDGALIATGSITPNSGLLSSSMPLSIGARESADNDPVNYDFQFYGDIDDVSIYNYVLTPEQAADHYDASGIAPTITQLQPSDAVSADEGDSVSFTVSADGTEPFTYQWYDNNGNPISNATNATLNLSNLQTSQAGNYQVIVNNTYGPATTNLSLSIGSGPPVIAVDLQPINLTGYVGATNMYSVTVSGSAPFYYQWYENGTAIDGATNHTYTFAVLAGTNTYYCAVENSYSGGTPAVSSTATVIGIMAPTLNPADFSSQLKIKFSGYNRSEILKDFPVLVELGTNVPGFSFSQFASPDGADLRFTDASGTREIPYEIDQWNPNGTSTVWVQVPALSGTNDAIWAYWGSPDNAASPDYTTNGAVWVPPSFESASPFEAVYHMEQSGFPYLDSTLQYPATNGIAPTPSGVGIVGDAGTFANSQYLDNGSINLGNAFTLSAWVNVSSSVANIQCIWANGPGVHNSDEIFFYVNDYDMSDGALILASGDGSAGQSIVAPAGSITFNQWHLVTAVVDRADGAGQLYVDGNQLASGLVQNDFSTNTDLNLGRDNGGSFQYNGLIDEARIRSSLSSSNWIWASYMTVASNDTFEVYSGATNSTVSIDIQHSSNNIILTWPEGTLQSADQVTGPYSDVPGAVSPYTNTVSETQQFYRVHVGD